MSIAEKLQELEYCKNDIKNAIITKGGTITGGMDTYGNSIRELSGTGSNSGYKLCDYVTFQDQFELQYIPDIDTSDMTTMYRMFYNCQNIVTIPEIDTAKVSNMQGMFDGCDNIISIPMLNTQSVIYMESMFGGCYRLTTVPQFNTNNVQNMWGMFGSCHDIIDIPYLYTENVSNMGNMFYKCKSIKTVPSFITRNVLYMNDMFRDCTSLETVPQFDTISVREMGSMFYNCSNLKEIPRFNTRSVRSISYMFYGCTKLTTIPELDCSNIGRDLNYDSDAQKSFGPFGAINLNLITNIEGFTNLKQSWTTQFLSKTPNVTVVSMMNIINKLYDWSQGPSDGRYTFEDGEIVAYGTDHTLDFGFSNIQKLTSEQIAIATNKGWTLT